MLPFPKAIRKHISTVIVHMGLWLCVAANRVNGVFDCGQTQLGERMAKWNKCNIQCVCNIHMTATMFCYGSTYTIYRLAPRVSANVIAQNAQHQSCIPVCDIAHVASRLLNMYVGNICGQTVKCVLVFRFFVPRVR